MRSNSFVTFVLLATITGSTLAAPSPAAVIDEEPHGFESSDIEARAGFGGLLASAGKGLLTGAGLAGLTTFLQNELGGGSQRRELTPEQLATLKALAGQEPHYGASVLAARAGAGGLLASAGKGLATGAGLAALTDFLKNEFGGSSKREPLSPEEMAVLQMLTGADSDLHARGLGSLFVKGGEDIASILGKGIAGGVGSGVGASIINGIFGGSDQQKREFVERGLGSLFVKGGEDIASILGKGIAGGVGSGVGASVINGIFGNDQQKREFEERGLGSLFVKGGEDTASILGKGIAGGVGSGVGASIINGIFGGDDQKREFDERGLGSLFVKGGEDIASILGKGIAGGVGSGVGASVINGIFGGSDQQKREILERGLGSLFVKGGEDIASILGKGIAGGVGSGVGASIINGIFGGDDNKREIHPFFRTSGGSFIPVDFIDAKREPVNPLLGLLIGQGASFGTSQLVQEGIDKVEGLFKGGKRELSLNELD